MCKRSTFYARRASEMVAGGAGHIVRAADSNVSLPSVLTVRVVARDRAALGRWITQTSGLVPRGPPDEVSLCCPT